MEYIPHDAWVLRLKQLVGILLVACATSCTHYYYSPNQLNTPYLEKQHDAIVTAGIGGGFNTSNIDVQLAYSPVKHGAIMLNYFQTSRRYNETFAGSTVSEEGTKGHFIEAGVGAYHRMEDVTGALYVGWGQGKMRNDYGELRFADLTYRRAFLQPTLTIQNNWFRPLRLGIALRVLQLDFFKGRVDNRIDADDREAIENIERTSPFVFAEGGVNLGLYFKPVTIQGNIVIARTERYSDLNFDQANIGLSLSLDLNEILRRK